jgi:hypothetical protein
MLFSHQYISLDAINLTTTEWNLHPWEYQVLSPELQTSMGRYGILHPPLVLADSAKTFAVVSGARRIKFIKQLNDLSQVHCLVIDKDAPHSFILDLILTEQTSAGPLSLAEKARFIEIACRLSASQDLLNSFLKKMQLKSGRSTISNLMKILEQDEIIIQEIHAGRMQDRMVTELLSLPEEADRQAMTLLFKSLRMGDGQQKKFFNLIRDISFREGYSISLFFKKKAVVEILDHKLMNIPQKIQHLGNLLQHAIAPTSALAEEAFIQQVKSLQLPTSHSIAHCPFFEKDDVTLSITFKNFADCARYLGQQEK